MAPTGALLNPEPSKPTERKKNHLPPKSYADAAEENLPQSNDNGAAMPELYSGQGEDEAPRTPKRHMHKKSSSQRLNGHAKEKKERRVVIERFTDKDGEHLVSLEPSDVRIPMARRTNSELLSGRKAGARWAQSP